MINRKKIQVTILPALLIILLSAVTCLAADRSAFTALADRVQALGLGMQGYVLGRPLTSRQKAIALAHPVAGSYKGTYRFRDGGLVVVADTGDDRVLAMYQRRENVGFAQLKNMVAHLMTAFAEPTTMAHDKILYWAFNEQGQVSEDAFNKAKKDQKTRELGILATVKLNSTMAIMAGGGTPDTLAANEETGTIYFIITSDPMVQAFMAGQG